LLFPARIEQVLHAQLLHGLGVGHYALGPLPPAVVSQEVRQILLGRSCAEESLAVAAVLKRRGPADCLTRIVQRCLALLEQPVASPTVRSSP
jgi:hypothetical protein